MKIPLNYPNVRYRYRTLKNGQKIRLAFVNNRVVEVKKPDGTIERFPKRWRKRYGLYRSK